MSVAAQQFDLHQVYQWGIDIEGFTLAQFTDCDHPSDEADVVEFAQPGTLHNVKGAGRLKFAPIVFSKGMLLAGGDKALYNWFRRGADPKTGISAPPSRLKLDVNLYHLDGSGNRIETWVLHGTWTSKVEYSKLEGKSDYMLEKGTLQYDWSERL